MEYYLKKGPSNCYFTLYFDLRTTKMGLPSRKRSLYKCAISILLLNLKIGKYTFSLLFVYFSEMCFMYFSEIYLKLHKYTWLILSI